MNNCNDTKARIDNFAHLTEEQRREVSAHIATCSECSEYKEVADSTANLLGAFSDALNQSASNERTFQRIQQRASKGRRQTLVGLVAMVTSLFAFVWFFSKGNMETGAAVLLLWAVGSGAFAWWSARKASRFSGVSGNTSDNFLARWKKDLTREIKVVTAVAAIVAIEVTFSMFALAGDNFTSDGAAILLSLNAVLAIAVGYAFAIELPALKRERSLLSENQ